MTIIFIRRLIVLAALAVATTALAAAPDRDGLIAAWESHLGALPSTKVLEPRGEQTWFLEDTDLPYRGEIRLAGALVRPADNVGGAGDFSHMGLVEIQLTDLTDAQRATQSYYYWLSDRTGMARHGRLPAGPERPVQALAHQPGAVVFHVELRRLVPAGRTHRVRRRADRAAVAQGAGADG